MDVVTHSMAGLLIGSLAGAKDDRLYPALLTGALASALPDLDAFIKLGGMDLFYKYHRVFTHTVFATPFIAAPAALPAWIWFKKHYLFFYLIACGSFLTHLGLDLVALWPIMLFYPLSKKDYAMNLLNNKDTSYVALFALTVLTMGMLYLLDKKRRKNES